MLDDQNVGIGTGLNGNEDYVTMTNISQTAIDNVQNYQISVESRQS